MNNNPKGTGINQDAFLEQELNGLRQQYEQLRDDKVRSEQQVEDLSRRLETLKAQAEADYGTSDPEKLEALLQEKRQENERIVADYRKHIAQIQTDLAAVERSVDGGDE